ncbi:MAG: hypothetical protein BGO41_03035 [Clostridiales bacterium 38-18]|nr:MAG: hypothetical protein BGO41_03035 [Clostridiales bacterium 38-18]
MDNNRFYESQLSKPETLVTIKNNPWKTILIYMVLGFAWIKFSDTIVAQLTSDYKMYMLVQSIKGSFYVLLTGGLLYFLIRMDNRKIFQLSRSLSESNQELVSFSEEMIAVEEELKNNYESLQNAMKKVENHKLFIEGFYTNTNTSVVAWKLSGEIVEVNPFYTEVTQTNSEKILGQDVTEIVFDNCDINITEFIENLRLNPLDNKFESRLCTEEGSCLTFLWSNAIMHHPELNEEVIVSFGLDVSKEKEKEKQIYDLAFKDKLTGLHNKTVFEIDVNQLIESKQNFTLLYLDFDNFKNINEVLGHAQGDTFLKNYAHLIKEAMPNLICYRWSGDEFALVAKTEDTTTIKEIIAEIMKLTKKKWIMKDFEYFPSISIGVTQFPKDGFSHIELLKNAEMALYKAKESGKQQCCYYEKSFQAEVERLIAIESTINRTLIANTFELFYQPIYKLSEQLIVGFEALLRWQVQTQAISTGDLIDVAEKTGQIIEIDQWVIDNAFKFSETNLKQLNKVISINLSAKSLTSSQLIPHVSALLDKYDINPDLIEFEITEHSLIENFDVSLKSINELKRLGFKIALDDFGTRFSSLNYLRKIPFDTLKIDKSYIDQLSRGGKDQLIVEQIIQLSKKLGLKTNAEGIEELAQANRLVYLGCDYGQGYYLSRPVPEDKAIELIR